MKLQRLFSILILIFISPSIAFGYSKYCVGGNLIDRQITEFQMEAIDQTSFWSYFVINGKPAEQLSGRKELGDFNLDTTGLIQARHTFDGSTSVVFNSHQNSKVVAIRKFSLNVFQNDVLKMDVVGFCFETLEAATMFFDDCGERQKKGLNTDECDFDH